MPTRSPLVYRYLMAVGLLGIVYRTREDADIVNDAVEATLKHPMQFRACRAIVTGMSGDGSLAKSVLGDHLRENPDDEAARVAMAVSLMLAGDPDGRAALESVLATTTNDVVRRAVNGVMDYMSQPA
ncbi:MAG TPA: hypothetical protein VFR90_10660 [Methylibium sp.]|uniref:hypothetical protein n=1 Tax=Methylibium sp. TaxID=2067992 RepID=UPI002DB9AFEC|nr:hypothetical protein [Methylibium sp.]HEU4459574.1 hypothetical protein [Methylibium sp.]